MHRYVDYNKLTLLNKLILDYLNSNENLAAFVTHFPSLKGFKKMLDLRSSFPESKRQLLAQHFERDFPIYNELQKSNAEKLISPDTFVVATAHQPNILFGPLYFILKTISTIKLAQYLSEEFTDIDVIPVFVLGSEDHDTEELNHVTLFGKKVVWEDDQKGAFGRREFENFEQFKTQLFEIFGTSKYADELKNIVEEIYSSQESIGTATKVLLTKMFAQEGLLVLDADDAELKRSFIPVMKRELTEQFSEALVKQTSNKLEALGYHAQVHARNLNLFYLAEQSRIRIEATDNGYSLVGQSKTWTQNELLHELDDNPDRFSPNVILRPLYQEWILPNLAYVGGAGELSYWFQLKGVFDNTGLTMPLLILRNQVLVIKPKHKKLLNKLNVSLVEIFKNENNLIKDWLKKQKETNVDLGKERQAIRKLIQDLKYQYESLTKPVDGFIDGQMKQLAKIIDKIEKRLVKEAKHLSETQLSQLSKLRNDLFPNGNLQERETSFMEFYLTHGPGFIQQLLEELDPLCAKFSIISLDE